MAFLMELIKVRLFDIHRTALCYDFDGESGLGLVLGKVEEGINFL